MVHDLFVLKGERVGFYVHLQPRERKKVEELIKEHGGEIVSVAECSIVIVNSAKEIDDLDVHVDDCEFLTAQFIFDNTKIGHVLDPTPYRVSPMIKSLPVNVPQFATASHIPHAPSGSSSKPSSQAKSKPKSKSDPRRSMSDTLVEPATPAGSDQLPIFMDKNGDPMYIWVWSHLDVKDVEDIIQRNGGTVVLRIGDAQFAITDETIEDYPKDIEKLQNGAAIPLHVSWILDSAQDQELHRIDDYMIEVLGTQTNSLSQHESVSDTLEPDYTLPPKPPTETVSHGARGMKFTPADNDFFLHAAVHMRLQNPPTPWTAIAQWCYQNAPHHSAASWNNRKVIYEVEVDEIVLAHQTRFGIVASEKPGKRARSAKRKVEALSASPTPPPSSRRKVSFEEPAGSNIAGPSKTPSTPANTTPAKPTPTIAKEIVSPTAVSTNGVEFTNSDKIALISYLSNDPPKEFLARWMQFVAQHPSHSLEEWLRLYFTHEEFFITTLRGLSL